MPVIPDMKVEINEIENGDKYYRQFSFPLIEIAGGANEGYADLVIPFDFWFLSIEFFSGPGSGAVLGDSICALVSPELSVAAAMQSMSLPEAMGEIQAALSINDNEVTLHAGAMGNEDLIEAFFRIGTTLQFEDPGDPGSPHASEYVVTALDRANAKATLARFDKSTRVFTTGSVVEEAYASGSKIWRTIVAGDSINVMPTYDGNIYGESKIGSSKLPANTPFRVKYTKKAGDTDPRTVAVNIEGMVGDRP